MRLANRLALLLFDSSRIVYDFSYALWFLLRADVSRLWLTKAYAILAHFGQKYNGEPFWRAHVLGVVKYLRDYGGFSTRLTAALYHIAWLHDLLEDTRWPLPFWLTDREKAAIRLLTHSVGVPYFEYIHTTIHNEDARQVKLADARFNRDMCTMSHDPKYNEMAEKYSSAVSILHRYEPYDPKYVGMSPHDVAFLQEDDDTTF